MRHLLALALLSAPVLANGTIEVRGGHGSVALTRHSVRGVIRDQLAEVTVEQAFVSRAPGRVEGVYVFPLPPGASVAAFEMTNDGKTMKGEIVERDKARRIYESIVSRKQDPALLEKIGDETFRARVFPIDPEKEVSICLTYQQLLDDHDGLVELRYPLARERLGAGEVAAIDLRFEIESSADLVSVASPSHDVKVEKDGARRAFAACTGGAGAQAKDLLLRVQRDPKAIGFTLMGDADTKTFLAILSPPTRLPDAEIPPRDLVYVVDTSGSMNGDKMKQAKRALKHGISLLRERDRFRILAFSTEVNPFHEGWLEATLMNKEGALNWIERLDANGGTAIDEALRSALASGDPGRLTIVVFLTDGLPTVGEVDPKAIVANVKARNTAAMRVFCFGVGFDQGVPFLDGIAEATRASREYVTEGEDLEAALVRFFDRVQHPALTDLVMEWGSGARETYPHPLPDLFAGDRLVIAGRYETPGPCLARLRGVRLGKPVDLVYEGTLPEKGGVPAVARLWAQRKIDFLLGEIERNGMNKELKDAIVSLATKHHIVTPYTAGLVVEDEPVRPRETVMGERIEAEEISDRNEVDTDSEFDEGIGGNDGLSDAPFTGPRTNSAIGLGGGAGGGRRGRGGKRNLRAGGGSGLTENSVELSLQWLSARQDGATGAIGGVEETSLALLAFLGAGYTDRGSATENKYAKCVRASLRFLIEAQDEGGCFADRKQPGWLRAHTAATQAMCEAFWMTRNPRYKGPAQGGLDLLAAARTRSGCWSDGTRDDGDDVLATVSAALAMKSGKFAGLGVDPDAFGATRTLLERREGSLSPVEQAAALVGRVLLGEDPRGSEAIRSLADALLARLPAWSDATAPPVDLWYFGTLGIFQAGGAHWRKWNDAMVMAIVKSQHPKEAADLAGAWTRAGAPLPVADQAKLAMCLEVYYRYDRVFGVR
ncbi:MAG: VWA domain-containing protein [Planctomycetes bacterium]|nr:VWA domain-containing protein [Planctomycetota bacterium]